MGKETGIDCSKDKERFVENKTRTRQKTHMGDSCWPRDAQACLVRSGFGGFGRAKRGGAARATRQQKELQFRIGSEQSRAKRGDGRGWSDRRTGRERAPAQRSQSIALRVARMLVGGRGPMESRFAAQVVLVQLFFQLVSSALVAAHAGHSLAGCVDAGRV